MSSNVTFKKFHQKIRQSMVLVGFEPGSPAWEPNILTTRPQSTYINQMEKIRVFKLNGVKRGITRHA